MQKHFISLFMGLLFTSFQPGYAGVDGGIKNIHATFSGDPRHEVTVAWRTEGALEPVAIRYGPVDRDPSTWVQETGETMDATEGRDHRARLTGLNPGVRYGYRVTGPGGVWGPVCTFRTAPDEGPSFTFAVIGDVQGKEAPSAVWQQAGDWLADQDDVAFALLLGDLVDNGYAQTQWDAFFNSIDPAHSRRLFHAMILMPLIGNHDTYGGTDNRGGLQRYLKQFTLPPNGQEEWEGLFYTFDVLNARFIILDTEGAVPNRTAYLAAQTQWMNTLDWAAQPWVFVAHHRPVYEIKRHLPSAISRYVWRPHFFDRYADIVFNGHNHSHAVTYPMQAARLHGMSSGKGFAAPWQAEVNTGCASGLPNLFLLEDGELIRYPGYQAAGRSVNTYPAGALRDRAIQATRSIEPIAIAPGTELWMGYLYQKRGSWYAEDQGGWRLSSSTDLIRYRLQAATSRVETNGHFRIHAGAAHQDSREPIASEGHEQISGEPFFVLVKFVFEEGRVTGRLKTYRAPQPLPAIEPELWDATVIWEETWNANLDTLTLLGEDVRRESWMDEFRLGRRMEDVLLIPDGAATHAGHPLVEERFDTVSTIHAGDRVVYYDGGGINYSGPANETWYIRSRQHRPNLPLLGLFTVTPERVTGRTVFFADYEKWKAGDVFDTFELMRR